MVCAIRLKNIGWRRLLAGVMVGAIAGACGSSGGHPAPPPSTVRVAPTTTTLPGVQTTGPRTVLSPIGLNVRSHATKSAPAVGTAAWGSVLAVLGHIDTGGGWFEVKGATHQGWITDDPTLSARGEFYAYVSGAHLFSVLYPTTWTFKDSPPASVVFSPTTGTDSIVAITAATVSKLPQGRAGYAESGTHTVVVCGVTGHLVTYTRSGAPASTRPTPGAANSEPYLLQIRLALDAHHALGLDGNLTNLGAPLVVFSNFVNSVSFPFPQCVG